MKYNLTIQGDSEVVIKQLKGEYQVRHEVLKNYHVVCVGLLEQIKASIANENGTVEFQHIPRKQNHQADALAKQAAATNVVPNLRFFHYPCQCSLFDGEIQRENGTSVKVKVAHDVGSTAYTPEVYIDAAILRSLNGDAALKELESTGKKNLIEGKSEMTVLGTTCLHITFGHGRIVVKDALVVDFLPWPLQISMRHPAFSYENVLGPQRSFSFSADWKAQLPERFQSHPYWTSDVMVAGVW